MQEEGFKEWMAPEALLYYYIKHTSKHVPFDDDDAAAAAAPLMMSLIRSEEMTTTMKTRFSLKGKNKKQKPTNT